MRKYFIVLFAFLFISTIVEARVRYVDPNGGSGRYQTIQAAIDAAIEGDTVRIFPGVYNETVTIGKNIVVQGGGLNTLISPIGDYIAVDQSAGILMWVVVSGYYGIKITSGTVKNCIIMNCMSHGLFCSGPDCIAINCIGFNNGGEDFITDPYNASNSSLTVINCIAQKSFCRGSKYTTLSGGWTSGFTAYYCCGKMKGINVGYGGWSEDKTYVPQQIGCINVDPGISTDGSFRLSSNSPCRDSGSPTLLDLDGTRSDMGYYGGPDAPLLPYITFPQNYKLNPDGTIQFEMQGKVGY